jgi:hypothetical protein
VKTETKNSSSQIIRLALKDPIPDEVDAGTDFSFVVIVTSPSEYDLSSNPFQIIESDRVLLTGKLLSNVHNKHETAEITITAPQEIKKSTWTFVIPAHENGDTHYEETSLSFSFKTKAHATSLAVWDYPSPVVIGEVFKVKVGAKCTASCELLGKEVEIHDKTLTKVGSGTLGETPWPGTTALYWTSINLQAPTEEGCFSWSLRFSANEISLPHDGASASFGFITTKHPKYDVAVTIVEKNSKDPVHDVHVRLGVHRTSTDETGVARFTVPDGDHKLSVWKAGYDGTETTIQVIKHEQVQLEMTVLPEADPFDHWQG